MWLAYCWSMMVAARATAQNASAAGSLADYDDWRDRELQTQFNAHFRTADVAGKNVVDFGCGAGGLARHVRSLGAVTVVGVELSAAQVTRAPAAEAVAYRVQSRPDRIDLPNDSADVILCFDVIEHIMCYRDIFREWTRIFRPGGSVLAWWSLLIKLT